MAPKSTRRSLSRDFLIYEDNHLLVVTKPVNIPVQADDSGDDDMLELLKADLKKRHNKPGNVFLGLVHRLDRPVGGVMVFAKTSKAASRLSDQIRRHKMKKTYHAVVEGQPRQKTGRLEDVLLNAVDDRKVRVVKPGTAGGKESMLDFKVLAVKNDHSLVSIDLITGRRHQIRVQFSSRAHALYGDQRYGEQCPGKQIALWATSLTLEHPTSKELMTFDSPLPETLPWSWF